MRALAYITIAVNILLAIVGGVERMYTSLVVSVIVLALLTIADVLSDRPKTKGRGQ